MRPAAPSAQYLEDIPACALDGSLHADTDAHGCPGDAHDELDVPHSLQPLAFRFRLLPAYGLHRHFVLDTSEFRHRHLRRVLQPPFRTTPLLVHDRPSHHRVLSPRPASAPAAS